MTGDHELLVEVAVPVPLRRTFTYAVPAELAERAGRGARVVVPFHGRKTAAFVLGPGAPLPEGVKAKPITGVLDDEPVFPAELLAFLIEAADYYLHPIGEVLKSAAPALPANALRLMKQQGALAKDENVKGKRVATRKLTLVRPIAGPIDTKLGDRQREALAIITAKGLVSLDDLKANIPEPRAVVRALEKKGLVATEEREVFLDPFFAQPPLAETRHPPNEHQAFAIAALENALRTNAPGSFLLQGVTGSGKTEVYLRVIEIARELGRGALLMVPEIALTPQLVSRFRARFGDRIAVLHSALRDKEREEHWRALRRGSVQLAIGARSALFAPVEALGVIVVDEEHDGSFKQEEGFRYQARDLALLRAARANAVCILGSATPSIEMRHMADQERLTRLVLPDRATSNPLPSVEIVDLKRHRTGPSQHSLISAPLYRAIEECLADRGQAILFLNRRGFAPSVRCAACGHVPECPSCSVTLTEHRHARSLRCHYCDFSRPMAEACIECGQTEVERIGAGTEQLEGALAEAFAPARVARLDRDTATGDGITALLERLRNREIDLLIGTQMVTKGHDLPGVTLVGVLLADQSLAFPDFRANERTFQLLSQVAGRAGRGDRPGRVLFQTYQTEHPAIQLAAKHDYESFYAMELGARRDPTYPPFARLVAIRVDAPDANVAEQSARALADAAHRSPFVREGRVKVLGPAEAPIARLRGRFRFRLLLKAADRRALREVARAIAARIDEGLGTARASVDLDPVSML